MEHDSDAPGEAAALDDAVRVVAELREWYETCYVTDGPNGPSFAEAFARSAARRRLDDAAEHGVTQWW